jgi:hypothetical protein
MARDTTRKSSFNPTSRRSSHLRTDQDRPGRCRTLNRDRPRPAGHMSRWQRFSAPTRSTKDEDEELARRFLASGPRLGPGYPRPVPHQRASDSVTAFGRSTMLDSSTT